MQNTPSNGNPQSDARREDDKAKDGGRIIGTGAVEHVLDTGMPPGIRPEELTDPGNANEKGPADNRS
jgi:hypothetical protein